MEKGGKPILEQPDDAEPLDSGLDQQVRGGPGPHDEARGGINPYNLAVLFEVPRRHRSAREARLQAFADEQLPWMVGTLVNNAGISHHAAFAEITEDDFDALFKLHLKRVLFLTQKLLPLINDGGRILNVSSGLTRINYPRSAAYGSIKGAVEVLTRYLARELGPRRIAVNVVAPGAIATDFSGGMVRDKPEIKRQFAAITALGQAGLPDDIGPMVASPLSEDNRWVSAQRIEVSGGMAI